jgi:hypothetical protein
MDKLRSMALEIDVAMVLNMSPQNSCDGKIPKFK